MEIARLSISQQGSSTNEVIFASDYKTFLRIYLKDPRNRGTAKRLAEILRVQASFLSKLMNSKAHLSSDQAFLIAEHLFQDESRQKYFQILVEFCKSSNQGRRKQLSSDMDKIRHESAKVENYIGKSEDSPLIRSLYYSNWHFGAIHLLTSIRQFQSAKAIARKLGLSEEDILSKLKILQSWGLVKQVDQHWIHSSASIHLNREQGILPQMHSDWRNQSLLSLVGNKPDTVHFTNVHTLSLEDYRKIQKLTLDFIKNAQEISGPSNPEECMILLVDVFRI